MNLKRGAVGNMVVQGHPYQRVHLGLVRIISHEDSHSHLHSHELERMIRVEKVLIRSFHPVEIDK